MIKLNKFLFPCIALGLLSGVVNAETTKDKATYVAVGVGQSILDPEYSDGSPGPGDNDVAWQVHVGHDFNKYLGAEISFADLGNFELDNRKASYQAYSAQVLGYYPLSSNTFSIYGKAGVSYISIDNQDDLLVDIGTKTGFSGGLGMRLKLNDAWAVRAEYNLYNEDIHAGFLNVSHSW